MTLVPPYVSLDAALALVERAKEHERSRIVEALRAAASPRIEGEHGLALDYAADFIEANVPRTIVAHPPRDGAPDYCPTCEDRAVPNSRGECVWCSTPLGEQAA